MTEHRNKPETTIRNKVSYRFFGDIVKVILLAVLVTPPGTAHSAHSAHASATFAVDSTIDAVDANPGDGLCATAGGECTLRAAIQETNALLGDDTITLPAGIYALTIPGGNDSMAAKGDLDIRDELTLSGAGRTQTLINGNYRLTDDRVFEVMNSAVATIQNVTIGQGKASQGGGILNYGILFLEGTRLHGNIASGPNAGGGGGVSNSFTGNLTVNDSILSGNKSLDDGGAIGNSGRLTITRSTLSGNTAIGGFEYGGAISNYGGVVHITHSLLSGNSATLDGGGIYHNGGTLTVSDSALIGNLAPDGFGGGIYTDDLTQTGRLTISYSTFSSNQAEYGGGLYNDSDLGGSFATILFSTFSGNQATVSGGAISNAQLSPMTISCSTLTGNTASEGGAVGNFGDLTISHSTLSGNSASSSGGGLHNSFGLATINNSTVYGNSANSGGGIYLRSFGGGTAVLGSSILAGNVASSSGPDCTGEAGETLDSAGHNLLGNNSDCDFIAAEGDLVGTPDDPIEPLLGPLQDNGGPTFTHALLDGSPAIDTGSPDDCPPTDQRGYPRPVDGDGNGSAICDIGSYEFGSAP